MDKKIKSDLNIFEPAYMKKLLKNIAFLSMTALTIPLCQACGGNDSEPVTPTPSAKEVKVSYNEGALNPDYQAQTIEITVTADVDWSIRTDADWITLRPAGGVKNEAVTVKATITANTALDSRAATLNIISGGQTVKSLDLVQGFMMTASSSASSFFMSGEGGKAEFTVTANGDWMISSEAEWLSVTPNHGSKGETTVTATATPNESDETRTGSLVLTCGDSSSTIEISQLNYKVDAPEGYVLVWSDEFNVDGKPGSDWVIENQSAGWVNNELQTYTSREIDGKLTLEAKNGFLHINCFKGNDGKIYSGRMNAKPSTGWTYGYVEARINLPSGKGTWPAFWMMPSNVDWNTNGWPRCGEIDIMEEVGVDKNRVSSSLHTWNYNHTKNTQKTHEMYLDGAEGEFHIYALEWTEDAITTYVDGKVQLSVTKASMGSDHDSWPFHYAFYPILNLAWGGDWGGYAGVNEAALPVTMLVDYVRIFQKK